MGRDKVDLSKPDFNIIRVISVNKNSFVVSNGIKDIYAKTYMRFGFPGAFDMDKTATKLIIRCRYFFTLLYFAKDNPNGFNSTVISFRYTGTGL